MLDAHHVDVPHQHEGLPGPAPLEARDEARAAGRGLHDLGGDALAIEDLLDVARGLDLVAGGIGGVDLYEAGQDTEGFLTPGRLGARRQGKHYDQ